ncbi:MAG: 30S ribosomal protein S3 [Desulfobacca sp.]|nr:30S ribosomal protein S3 [Desulfobacca sp.]
MGQKVHPIGFRLGNYRQWNSRWFARNDYPQLLLEDRRIRDFIRQEKDLEGAGIASVDIERAANKVKIKIFTSRPGIVIGQKGRKIEDLRRKLEKLIGRELIIDIHEIRKPETNAQLVAENIALQLQRRIAFRRAMKKAVSQAMKFGVQGIKVRVAGRLGGAEMARKEWYREGRVPLHTLRADIDYGFAEAKTTYGVIGVKTWIFKGEILAEEQLSV